MAKYLSNKFKSLKIGLDGFSENKTSLTIIGNVGVGATLSLNSESGIVNAVSFKKHGGLSSEFLMADGSINNSTFLTGESDTLDSILTRGNTSTKNLTVGDITADNISVGGTITYDDVTSVDSLGIVTARSGIYVGPINAGVATITADGNATFSGIITSSQLNVTGITTLSETDINGDLSLKKTINTQYSPTTVSTPIVTIRNDASLNNSFSGLRLQAHNVNAAAASFNISVLNGSTNYKSTLVLQSRDTENDHSEKLRITDTGNIGIGITQPINPGHKTVHIHESASNQPVRIHMTTVGTGATAGDGFSLSIDGNNKDVNLIQRESADMRFYTAEVEKLRITSAGDVAIGRTEALANYAAGSTTTKLAVVKDSAGTGYHEIAHFTAGADEDDSGAIVRITQFSNDRGLYIKGGRGTNDQTKAIFGLRESTPSDNDVMTFIQGGLVGIGTDNPTQKLEVYAGHLIVKNLTDDAAKIILDDASGSYNHYQIRNEDGNFKIRNSGANPQYDVISVLSTGHVGINTNDPQGDLQVGTGVTVDGNAGIISATTFSGSFVGNGSGLSGVGVGTDGSINTIGIITAASFSGSGASLTNLPAGQLTGTVADARISTLTASKLTGDLPVISGANLTDVLTTNVGGDVGNLTVAGIASVGIGTTGDSFTGKVDLFHEGELRLKTTPAGVQVVGLLSATSLDFTGAEGAFNEDLILKGASANAKWDKSESYLQINDGAKVVFGSDVDSGDLEIYHSGNHSYINEDGTGELLITTGIGTTAAMVSDGSITLYHQGTERLRTTASGVTINGTISGTISGTINGNAATATDLDINATQQLVIQTGDDATDVLTSGTAGYILQSNGSGNAPTWAAAAPVGAIEGITLREDGVLVGSANSISTINFTGAGVGVTFTNPSAGIATVTVAGGGGDSSAVMLSMIFG